MNEALPVAVLQEAAIGTALPVHLRRQLAIAAWTRAALLDNDDAARALAPALLELAPEMKTQLAAYSTAKDAAERKDAALYLLLKFPGMRPRVDVGLARLTEITEIDNYRDNWWCNPVKDAPAGDDSAQKTPPLAAPEFLSPTQRAAFAAEKRKLDLLQIGPNDLCLRAVAWARRSPADPRVPEALHLAVKSTRFGCRDEQTRKSSKLAFDTLHKQFPNSAWTKQTKYFFGVD